MVNLFGWTEEVEEVEGVGELVRDPIGRKEMGNSAGVSRRWGVAPRTCPSFLVDFINLDFWLKSRWFDVGGGGRQLKLMVAVGNS